MRAFLILCAAIAVSLGVGIGVEAAQPVGRAAPPPPAAGSDLFVPARGPCPSSVTALDDVTNPSSPSLRRELLRPGAVAGIVCRYRGSGGATIRLASRALLNGRTAQRFEVLIGRLSLRRPSGMYSCPAEFPGGTILAFGYPDGSSVDLWYADSGCRTLGNGFVRAYEVSGPKAFAAFAALVDQLAPEPPIG